MTTLVSTPSEAEDRIGPSFYSQADLDAARQAAEQLGYGIGLKPARANPPAVAVRHDELAARAEAEAVAALDLKESASILGIDPGAHGAIAVPVTYQAQHKDSQQTERTSDDPQTQQGKATR